MEIKEEFYNISKSELFSLCKYINNQEQENFLISFYDRIEHLINQKRISVLEFKVYINGQE